MVRVSFTANLQRHVACPPVDVSSGTVRVVLGAAFEKYPMLREYILDDQGALRFHMVVFVDGAPVRDRERLSDVVADGMDVCVMQALSGG